MAQNNWSPVYIGLTEPKHIRRIGEAIWVYLYLVSRADRKAGTVFRKGTTIAKDLGFSLRSVRRHIETLRKGGYITTERKQYSLVLQITKWKPLANYKNNRQKVKKMVKKLSGEIGHL